MYRPTVLTLTPSLFATAFLPTNHSLNGITSFAQFFPKAPKI
jgi:hypothetical protein